MVEYVLLLEIMYILIEELMLKYQILNVCGWNFISITKKNLLGTFYRPPNCLPVVLDSIENSIGLAFVFFYSDAHEIIISGDFNLVT